MAKQVTQGTEDFLLQGIHLRAQRAEAITDTGFKKSGKTGATRATRVRSGPRYACTEKA